MKTKDEALKLALEALELFAVWEMEGDEQRPATDAIAAIQEALAQPDPFTPDWASYRQGKEDGQREWGGADV
jgi:hypothetical protein